MTKLIGKIKHYYDKIGVAVVQALDEIKAGSVVKIKASPNSGREVEFSQTVNSLQVEHQQVAKAQKGDTIGMKVDQPVKEGDEIYSGE